MSDAVILKDVSRTFGPLTALHSLSATLKAGQLTGIAGPDGAGKTTLMRLMAGLLAPDSGSITVAGWDTVKDGNRLADDCGYMPQRFGLYEDLTVMENLRLYAELRSQKPPIPANCFVARCPESSCTTPVHSGSCAPGFSHFIRSWGVLKGAERANDKARFDELLGFTRLAPFADRLAGKLSGGMKQKLGLACAMMAEPKVLLLDEPGVGVDPVSRQELWAMVSRLTGRGMAVVWATAYLDEAERCQSVLLLNEGELIYHGVPAELTQRLQQRSVRLTPIADWQSDRRAVLAAALDLPYVRDGTIEGEALRLVLHDPADKAPLAEFATAHGLRITTVTPRFEDAFIDLLVTRNNVRVVGSSALAAKMSVLPKSEVAPVTCDQLTKRFGEFTATDTVSFTVHQGEIFGLLGPNGAGKSTTFKMLCGLLKVTSGKACVMGLDLAHAPGAAKLKLGYMAQKFSLYGLLSVRQNLYFFAGVYGLTGRERQTRIDEMVETFALTPYLDRPPEELPLGFKQRLALACALMHRPPVLFLDEPTSGVDPLTRREFWAHINGQVRRGVTVLVTTHFMDEAEYCDRVALMYQSQVIALDTPDRLKAMVRDATPDHEPTMEDAFIRLIKEREKCGGGRVKSE